MARNTRRTLVAAALLVVVVLAVTIAAIRSNEQPYQPSVVSGAALLQGAPSTPPAVANTHLDGYLTTDELLVGSQPIADWVATSSVVAEVQVQFLGDLQFNTTGGVMPTQDPAELANPDAELVDTAGLRLFRPVVVSVQASYKTDDPTSTGYVLFQPGGTLPGSAGGYTHDVTPKIGFSSPATGVVFLSPPPSDIDSPWYLKLQEVADELNTVPGNHYRVMITKNWFMYQGALAASTWESVQYPISQLTAEIQAALGGPTPTP